MGEQAGFYVSSTGPAGGEDVHAAVFPTSLGWMTCEWSGGRLVRNAFGFESADAARASLTETLTERLTQTTHAPAELRELVRRLTRFADSYDDDFLDVPLALDEAAPFARRVLEACRRIPIGETLTYTELARLAGSPGAARAAGNTMARNRFPLVVPCHRVVGARGALGGYSAPSGLTMKRRLLAAEARTLNAVAVS
ncbi:MAG: methylated-DNA--[protein]-cysteine S-methyltransferase [Pirellulales bacterium]